MQRIRESLGSKRPDSGQKQKSAHHPRWVLHHSASPQRQDAGKGTVIRQPPASLPRPLPASTFPSKNAECNTAAENEGLAAR